MPVVKGTRTTTSPIPVKHCRKIEKLLADQPRNLCLFTLGIQSGLRIGTLLKLTIGQVWHLQPGDSIQVKESKTGKTNTLVMNKRSYAAIQTYIESCAPGDHEPLFKSRKGNKALSVSAVSKMVKGWCLAVGLKDRQGNFAAHSMRKSWATELRKKNVPIEMISLRLNHTSIKTTEVYLGITPTETTEMLMIEV